MVTLRLVTQRRSLASEYGGGPENLSIGVDGRLRALQTPGRQARGDAVDVPLPDGPEPPPRDADPHDVREAPRVVRVDWAAKDAAVWAAPSTAAPPLSPASRRRLQPRRPRRAAEGAVHRRAAASPEGRGGRRSLPRRTAGPGPRPPPAAPPVAAPAPPPAPPKPADPPTPPAPAAKTKSRPTIAGGRVEHLPGIRTFVLTLPDGRGELSVDGDRVEPASRPRARRCAGRAAGTTSASKVKQGGTGDRRLSMLDCDGSPHADVGRDGRLRGPRHNYRTAGGTGLQACLAQLAPRREATARVRDGDLEPEEVAAALSCDTAQPVLQAHLQFLLRGNASSGAARSGSAARTRRS